ncbi:MAG: V-type ATP synthase subunit D [Caldiserica bacterium]|nr:V-type ATP synthase subunit D [Caldisericota bacterium]
MLLNVNPTRMELLRLRDRLILAERGHKLLKEKLEGLMRNFLDVANQFIKKRSDFDKEFSNLIKRYYIFTSAYSQEELKSLFSGSSFTINLSSKEISIMNVHYPVFSLKAEGQAFSYPYLFTETPLDRVFIDFRRLLDKMVELASIQQELFLISLEISKVRRRVNALEYVMIPNLIETVKYITDKLEELERENIVRLLKVKDIISEH